MGLEQEIQSAMNDVIDHLKNELKNLRTSRANPAVLDNVRVEIYGTAMRLRDLGSISLPEARQLLITPFDPSNINAISKAIEAANLNLQPMVDGKVVRIMVPPMDESIRKDTVKLCKKKGEESKVSIREVRRKFNELVRKKKADGDLAEDAMKRYEKKIQESTDLHCKKVDELCAAREKEILEF